MSATRALKDVRIRLLDREVDCTALFDTGSAYTALDPKTISEVGLFAIPFEVEADTRGQEGGLR